MKVKSTLPLLVLFCVVLIGCAPPTPLSFSLEGIPAFSSEPYVVLNDNTPDFPQADFTETSFEEYSPLDLLGRCGPAYANVGPDTMPTEERGSIGQVKPSGWQTVKYDNVDGMLPFENLVADYVKETDNHVLYRVTPVFEGNNLVANGVQMEAMSVEDGGEGVCFNVYVYNNQPGIQIDYATGKSWLDSEAQPMEAEGSYVLNTSSKKFHLPDCSGVASMSKENRQDVSDSRQELLALGYSPCGQCKP